MGSRAFWGPRQSSSAAGDGTRGEGEIYHSAIMRGYGWAGSAREFLDANSDELLRALESHHATLMVERASESQRTAWADEYEVIRNAFAQCVAADPAAAAWGVVFEYELPLEGGRRPDVVVLAGSTVVVLEFKGGLTSPSLAAIDQVNGYARDLAEYHERTHEGIEGRGERSVVPVLVLPRRERFNADLDDAIVTGGDGVGRLLRSLATTGHIDLDEWLTSSYAPLPTLVAAAKRIFEHEDLPHVRRARSARIPETVELVSELARQAEERRRRMLILVTGVPGAGKTLVGLRVVYEQSDEHSAATFLSGNGPLVKVLQDALKSRVFVKDLHAYIRTYGINRRQPTDHVVVFDEAQRAWDREYMNTKKGIRRSEPELLMDAAERLPEWSAFVGLVGDGQEIHSGEEGGLGQWRGAIVALPDADQWEIHCPPRLADTFAPLRVSTHDLLDLTVSLRSRQAERLHHWVALLLQGSPELARKIAVQAQREDFVMYVSRDLNQAKAYCRERYVGEPDARYGLMASSHAKTPPKFGVDNSWMATSRMNIAKWYNAAPEDPKSCCALDQPVTEFACQGLEVDLPIVVWGEDMLWTGEGWDMTPVRRRYPLEDPGIILQNVYRVLLTRGRDGFIVFVPPDPRFDATAQMLEDAGVVSLNAAVEEVEGAITA